MLRALVRGQKRIHRAVVCIVTLTTYLSVNEIHQTSPSVSLAYTKMLLFRFHLIQPRLLLRDNQLYMLHIRVVVVFWMSVFSPKRSDALSVSVLGPSHRAAAPVAS